MCKLVEYYEKENEVCIFRASDFSKFEFRQIIKDLKQENPDNKVFNSYSTFLLIMGWAVNNFHYEISRNKKAHRDYKFKYPLSFLGRVGYFFLGVLVWPFLE